MATIRKRGNSYQIRVSCGYDTKGNQVEQSMTWKPEKKMTEKQIEKELNRIAVKFEDDCMNGHVTAAVKFQDFAEQWFKEYAEIKLKTQTIRCYHNLEKRVYSAIGHMRLDKITVRTIQKFVTELTEEKKLNSKGEAIGNLAPKTIKHHIAFISTVFDYAVKMQMLQNNPCKNVTLPPIVTKEREVYTLEEVQQMLDLFENESEANFKYVMFFTLAAFTGLRRGELLGLEWKDFDFENCLMTVIRTSEWTKEKGIYTDTPKTKSSNRMLKIPAELAAQLMRFKKWQDSYKAKIGSKWVETDRLFTKWNGEPMGMRSPYKFFEKFCKRTGMRFVSIHSFRHFNATAMILNGVDVKTVQTCLGHNDATTTLSIYAHSFQEAQVRAMESVADCIYSKRKDKNSERLSD
ncbi:MAG: site-specific integrase [Oscillospiraceae bacterium]|nr:site-specific integrase [Oscillospiraceae bacterium]